MKPCIFITICLLLIFQSGDCELPWLKVNTETNQIIRENDGSTIILHGVNVVYKIPPWYPSSVKWDHMVSFNDKDIKDLSEWGFNIIRLGVMWPGVHPMKDFTNMTYLAEIEQIINKLGEKGIYTLVDLHQDLLSRYACGEGAPDFLMKEFDGLHNFPRPLRRTYKRDENDYPTLDECLNSVGNFGLYYSTPLVNNMFSQLYTPGSELNSDLHKFWKTVAGYFANNPNVIGYDLINEPPAGNLYTEPWNFINPFGAAGHKYLQPLYESLHKVIRSVDTHHILFFEPSLNNGAIYTGFTQGPGGSEFRDRQILSHHVYCSAITPSGCPTSHWFCEFVESVLIFLKNIEIKNLGCGGLLTEFGALCELPDCIEELHRVQRKMEEMLEGWIYWQYKDFNDLTTANRDLTEGFYYKNGTLQRFKVLALTRPYTRIIAGKPIRMLFNTDTKEYELKYMTDAKITNTETEIYVNREYYQGKAPLTSIITPIRKISVNYKVVDSDDPNKHFVIIILKHSEDLMPGTLVHIKLLPSTSE